MENTFAITIRKCDRSPFRAFDRNLQRSGAYKIFTQTGSLELIFVGVNWERLMEWCHLVWNGKAPGTKPNPDPQKFGSVVDSALTTALVARHGSLSWALCKLQLDTLRPLAGMIDTSWLK
jgi:hypothetical protein